MTEDSAPPEVADRNAAVLTRVLGESLSRCPTELILTESIRRTSEVSPSDLEDAVSLLVEAIGTATEDLSVAVEADTGANGNFSTLAEMVVSVRDLDPSCFDADESVESALETLFGLPSLAEASDGAKQALAEAVYGNIGRSVILSVRAEACRQFLGYQYYRRLRDHHGNLLSQEKLRFGTTQQLADFSFAVAPFLPSETPHSIYVGTMVNIIESVSVAWMTICDDLRSCGSCGDAMLTADGTFVSGADEDWCESCTEDAFYCDSCGETYPDRYAHRGPHGDLICDGCYGSRVTACDNCGCDRWTDESCYECGCEEDEANGEYGPLRVMYYSYKPEPLFFFMDANGQLNSSYQSGRSRPESDGNAFFGVELETNIRRGGSSYEGGKALFESAVVSGTSFIYAKSDCTVSGPELVTHPATLAAHRHLWEQFPFRELTQNRWSGWFGSNAGLHVHIDRRAFRNRAHLARFQIYFGEWRAHLTQFGGRNCHTYGYHSDQMTGIRNGIRYATRNGYPNRGSAVNYENAATIEVRMFRSSLRRKTIMAYLEFLHGLIRYSETHTSGHIASERGLHFTTFAEWMLDNSNGIYHNALERITERVTI